MTKYCKCEGGLVLANLETGKGECPICKLPKKLSPRLKGMSKIYKGIENDALDNTGVKKNE